MTDRSKLCRDRKDALQTAAVENLRAAMAVCGALGIALMPRGQSLAVMRRRGTRTWTQTGTVPLPDIEAPECSD